MQIRPKRLVLGALLSCLTVATQAEIAMTDQPYVGQTWLVACRHLPMHQSASTFSRSTGMLNYRDEVRIEELIGKFDLPDSQQDKHRSNDEDSIMSGGAHNKEHFAWARVSNKKGQQGHVAMTCLVNGSLINGPYETPLSDPVQIAKEAASGGPEGAVSSRGFSRSVKADMVAMRGMVAQSGKPTNSGDCASTAQPASQPEAAVSSRGFSRKEKGDRVAMRGMTNGNTTQTKTSADCTGQSYDRLDAAFQHPVTFDPYTAFLEFRREGHLGEFK